MELDKKDICKIIDGEPNRIEHVKLKKYIEEEYAESAYRVKVDGVELGSRTGSRTGSGEKYIR